MDKKDIQLQLLSNLPIYIDNVPIYPISINEISRIGYNRFNAEMRTLCLTSADIKMLTGNEVSENDVYKYLVGLALSDETFMEAIVFWLSCITRSKVYFSHKKMSFTNGVFFINNNNFSDIQSIIRLRNGMKEDDEENENPENAAAARILKRRKEERLKRLKVKQSDENSAITLADLVSILANGLCLPISTVMEYDLYQFNDQFNRLKIKDDYEVNIQALLHGAKKEDIKFKHWITKIQNNSE